MKTEQAQQTVAKSRWMEPEVLSLDIADTAGYPNRGTDAARFLDCTKS